MPPKTTALGLLFTPKCSAASTATSWLSLPISFILTAGRVATFFCHRRIFRLVWIPIASLLDLSTFFYSFWCEIIFFTRVKIAVGRLGFRFEGLWDGHCPRRMRSRARHFWLCSFSAFDIYLFWGYLVSCIKGLLLLFLLISNPIVNFKNMSIGNDF